MSLVLLGSTSGSVTLNEPAVAGSTTINLPATSGTMAVLPTATSVLPEASGGTGTTTGYYGFKNRIINGAMMIDQRNAGASITANGSTFAVDRFTFSTNLVSKATAQRSTTAPTGFINSLLVTSSAATSFASGDYFSVKQAIEGFNCADLAWGTASAATVTVSFWVRSSLTGTFGGALNNSANNRSYPFSYTISSANTWEQKSVTIAGDTSGTWLTDNGAGIQVRFALGMGSTYSGTAGAWVAGDIESVTGAVNVLGTNGATFYITGVQLEKGSTATSFDYRPYGTELQLCQRYYDAVTLFGSSGTRGNLLCFLYTTTGWEGAWAGVVTAVPMRATPTITTVLTNVLHTGNTYSTITYTSFSPQPLGDGRYTPAGYGTVGTAGTAGMMMASAATGSVTFSAEL